MFVVGVLLMAAPLGLPLYQWEYTATAGRSVIWSPIYGFGVFLAGLWLWMRWVHHLKHPLRVFGILWSRQDWLGWLIAFLIGAAGVGLLCFIQIVLSWAIWTPASSRQLMVNAVEGFGVALLVGIIEELLFRGWLLFELEQDYSLACSLWINATLFAIAHYLRPLSAILATWPQFFGLLLLGVTLVWARRTPLPIPFPSFPLHRGARSLPTTLWLAMGLHSGLVWAYYQVDVGNLIVSTGRVPPWLTGIGDNPLAGGLGILVLGAIALLTYATSRQPSTVLQRHQLKRF